jgi:hypothetical protein
LDPSQRREPCDLLPGEEIIVYMLTFTKAGPDRVSHTEASAPATP